MKLFGHKSLSDMESQSAFLTVIVIVLFVDELSLNKEK